MNKEKNKKTNKNKKESKKFNYSIIMNRAWEIYRKLGVKDISLFGFCLAESWSIKKRLMEEKTKIA